MGNSILEADNFLGACCSKATTPKKLWTLLLFVSAQICKCKSHGEGKLLRCPLMERTDYVAIVSIQATSDCKSLVSCFCCIPVLRTGLCNGKSAALLPECN